MRRVLDAVLMIACAPTVLAAGDTAFVTCQNGDALSVIDLGQAQEVARWPVPGQPAGVAVAGNGVFTVSPGSKTIRRFDATGRMAGHTSLPGGPVGIAHDPHRGRIFISDWYNARAFVLDAATMTRVAELRTGAAPAGLALSDDGLFLATADRDADQVSIFDAGTLESLGVVGVGERPFGLRFSPDGRLWVANVGTNDVTILDHDARTVLATVPVGERPYGVAFAAGRAFVSNQYENTVSVIDAVTMTVERTLDVGEYPEGIDATTDGTRIVVANWFDNSVTIIDARSLSVIDTVDTCDGPRAFGAFVLGDGP